MNIQLRKIVNDTTLASNDLTLRCDRRIGEVGPMILGNKNESTKTRSGLHKLLLKVLETVEEYMLIQALFNYYFIP